MGFAWIISSTANLNHTNVNWKYSVCYPTYLAYEIFYDVISNETYRNAWTECFGPFDLDGSESKEDGCG